MCSRRLEIEDENDDEDENENEWEASKKGAQGID
jgi:hypothetical protein